MAIGFAVLDFETTGLDTAKDRVVEVAVIQLDPSGREEKRWESVIRVPEKDWSEEAENIHFVRLSHIDNAPSFGEIANELADLLEDRILVAHNVEFDGDFLTTEFTRIGAPIRGDLQAHCTLEWARETLDSRKKDLSSCCRVMKIPFSDAHRAMADCEATSRLWQLTLEGYKGHPPPISPREVKHRPGLEMPRVRQTQRQGMTREDLNMPPPTEAELKARAARSRGYRGRQSGTKSLWNRGPNSVTERELSIHLRHVMQVGFFAQLLNRFVPKALPEFVLSPGERVTFSGETGYSRASWEALLRCLTLDPGGIANFTKVVVNNDASSEANKVTRAKEQGIPILTEKAFMDLLRHSIEAGSIPSTLDFSLAEKKKKPRKARA